MGAKVYLWGGGIVNLRLGKMDSKVHVQTHATSLEV